MKSRIEILHSTIIHDESTRVEIVNACIELNTIVNHVELNSILNYVITTKIICDSTIDRIDLLLFDINDDC